MLKKEIQEILDASKADGWVLEPDAKTILKAKGLPVPRFAWAKDGSGARMKAHEIGYPVAVKVISPRIIHKSDKGGVAVDIGCDEQLNAAFSRFSAFDGFRGVLVEEMLAGDVELIVGATIDYQFGPVILLGLGGTSVEIYKDTALRLAPLAPKDVLSMVKQLKAHPLLEGFRGAEPVDLSELTRILVTFSKLVTEMEGRIESIDLNPVICKGSRCMIADARIILAK
jgi:succinyl-CoA synthetase beta subunit